ncbi:precorrin-2 dehydrogenase/sirohydrochlorin ferrochelatase family protein [Alicyclobacillus macrosporangiidus]|uniref:precorrin-2 dehydrogenase/sirohydrochlorin ferrochelatase family protein n=1 Tax=Alicyclobacillus macrosporangiidus TaxID=392015 RepID=UPI0009DCBEFE|nr:bifunctional precorrin-2 dehydrogenase/sirohydrochlorin ferrochelatase [Alicyclobacillus macrosporangiidus]
MPGFTVSLDLRGKLCVVIGGGRVAARKVEKLVAAGAKVRVISPALEPRIRVLVGRGDVVWVARRYEPGDLSGARLVIAATDQPEVNQQVAAEAERMGCFVNVADRAEACTCMFPATVRVGDITVAISTDGQHPGFARSLREALELDLSDGGRRFQALLEQGQLPVRRPPAAGGVSIPESPGREDTDEPSEGPANSAGR